MKYVPLVVTVSALLLFLFIKYGSKTIEEEAFYAALGNFTYKLEPYGEDKHLRYTHHDKPFTGDCEDFAFTLQSALGGEVWVVEHKGDIKHAVLLANGVVYDNFYQMPIPRNEYPTEFLAPLTFRGKVINNQ